MGEGLLGLPRALIQAGCAASVVATWVVNDATAAQLMTAFYTNLLRGWTVARALRFAMLEACTVAGAPHETRVSVGCHAGAELLYEFPKVCPWRHMVDIICMLSSIGA